MDSCLEVQQRNWESAVPLVKYFALFLSNFFFSERCFASPDLHRDFWDKQAWLYGQKHTVTVKDTDFPKEADNPSLSEGPKLD